MSEGWADGNQGENRVIGALRAAGIATAFNDLSPTTDCRQQYAIGPYVADFAWPKLKIALEADGSIHRQERNYRHDQKRDAWLREQGWLIFRVDTTRRGALASQVQRVVNVVRALARA
jgi:very-short-patch-repair endonuclease